MHGMPGLRAERPAACRASIERWQPSTQSHSPKREVTSAATATRPVRSISRTVSNRRRNMDAAASCSGSTCSETSRWPPPARCSDCNRFATYETTRAVRTVEYAPGRVFLFRCTRAERATKSPASNHSGSCIRRAPEATHRASVPTSVLKKNSPGGRPLPAKRRLQDDGFRFPGRHELSARRRLAGHSATKLRRPVRAHTQN